MRSIYAAQAALLPEALFEYFASKRPVVAPDFAGLRALSGPVNDLFPYAAGDPVSLAYALVAASNARSDAGYHWVRSSRGINNYSRTLRTLYEHLLPGYQQVDAWEDAFTTEG